MPFHHQTSWKAHFCSFQCILHWSVSFSDLILFPQGFQFEVSGIIGYITRWDVHRYLKKTFSYAVNRLGPNVVVILGKTERSCTLMLRSANWNMIPFIWVRSNHACWCVLIHLTVSVLQIPLP